MPPLYAIANCLPNTLLKLSFWILFCFLPKYYIRISPIEKSNECIHQNSEFAKNSESNLLLRDQLTENVKILNDIQVSFSSDPDDIKR